MTRETARRLIPALLKTLTLLLIVFGMVIAAIAQGFGDQLSPRTAGLMHDIYMWYEHYFRALTVILGAFLTYALVKGSRKTVSRLRKNSLISLSIVSFVFLILFPLFTGYYELYNGLMPFPWSTLPLQLVDSGSFFEMHFGDFFGIDGGTFLLGGYLIYQAVVFGGTFFLGRRWQCGMLCLMNGVHAETLGEALPFVTHNKKKPQSKRIRPRVRWVLRKLQIVLLIANLALIAAWILVLTIEPAFLNRSSLISAERIKYLSVELTLLMLLWVFIGGRGYCFYCPAGLFLGIVGNAAGQRIETNLTRCIDCGACDEACKLSIDISARAREGKPVKALQCVGCGLCVEACPTNNLRYSTGFLRYTRNRKK
ncbi:MAG: 4Fe-4S binding protein [Spirochaetia bacterium]